MPKWNYPTYGNAKPHRHWIEGKQEGAPIEESGPAYIKWRIQVMTRFARPDGMDGPLREVKG